MVDVIVYVYDSSDTNSFSYISNLRVGLLVALFRGNINGLSTATIQLRSYSYIVRCNKIRSRSGASGGDFLT
jgi:hypothetical protein